MKHFKSTFLLFVALISCREEVSPDSLSKLNGYWEIQRVQLPNGEQKEYTINEMIDYVEWNGKVGLRKKVLPQLDGKFLINDEFEHIKILDSSGRFYINYQTKYAKWKEEIIVLEDSVLVLKNDQDLEYHYKRFKPILIQ